ncbi:MAG: hypothetical protein FGM26_14460, partial [Beijerinckiaceae bacterium]|nr:hypothetical protein [Beijerinckiaceae bacterium]
MVPSPAVWIDGLVMGYGSFCHCGNSPPCDRIAQITPRLDLSMSFFPRPAAKTERDRPARAFYAGRDLARAQTIGDLRAMAMRRLPRFSAEYLEGGAEEEITMRRNRAAFDAHVFKPRVIRDVSKRDLSRCVLGQTRALPFAIGPTGFNGLLWDQGDHV